MSRHELQIKAMISLKRQGAEQKLQALRLERIALEAEQSRLAAALAAFDLAVTDFASCHLAHVQGTVGRLLAEIARNRARCATLEDDIAQARDALKRAILAEEQWRSLSIGVQN